MEATSDPPPAAEKKGRSFGKAETKVPRPEAARTHNVREFRCHLHPRTSSVGAEVSDTPSLTDEVTANPCEALLAALGSSLSIGIHANAVARAIPIRHLEIEIAGEIGVAALWGTGDLTPQAAWFSNHHRARAHRG